MAEEFSATFYRQFPRDFRWGVATAAYQIEGAVQEDGRGASIWDTFSHTQGKTEGGDTGDVACDHYHRFEGDVRLMAGAGLEHYRLSLSWPRILPQGRGRVEPRGLAFYDRLVDRLLQNGIQPAVTLYHWDLPQALEDAGGWLNRDTASLFRDYAALVFQHLGDRVKLWITHNEPWCTAYLGHGVGIHAPGLKDPELAFAAGHHVLLSHGLAMEAWREQNRAGQIGITLNLNHVYPASEREEDIKAAELQDVFQNRWFLDPLFTRRYPDRLQEWGSADRSVVKPGDLDVIATPMDFLGVNYYSAAVVAQGDSGRPTRDVTPRTWVTDMGWPVMPEGLRDLLVRLSTEFTSIPLIVTENGMAAQDQVVDGAVRDEERVRYVRVHIEAVADAIARGARVHGYYLWSLMDNFEWGFGYHKRFGAIYVDYATHERIPKDSWHWYSKVLSEFREAQGHGASGGGGG